MLELLVEHRVGSLVLVFDAEFAANGAIEDIGEDLGLIFEAWVDHLVDGGLAEEVVDVDGVYLAYAMGAVFGLDHYAGGPRHFGEDDG